MTFLNYLENCVWHFTVEIIYGLFIDVIRFGRSFFHDCLSHCHHTVPFFFLFFFLYCLNGKSNQHHNQLKDVIDSQNRIKTNCSKIKFSRNEWQRRHHCDNFTFGMCVQTSAPQVLKKISTQIKLLLHRMVMSVILSFCQLVEMKPSKTKN